MTKLKFSAIPDDRPVKITPRTVRLDLTAYADPLNGQHNSVALCI
ncbi:hypothetical protein C7I87_23715 [Mesorhizobium sp. SARCC-RB16n]|nr:DUF2274 domain-containing protein [Mesorhizobium sp. SARCC-RB16n]KAA3447967.1 hypothetical protein C7I87_23715 [Mesorhizobium sp. SARCC-RB16n]